MSRTDVPSLEALKDRREQLKARVLTLKERIQLNEGKVELVDNKIVSLYRRRRIDTGNQEKLAKISAMMEATERTIEAMSVLQLNEITKYPRPPEIIQKALEAIFVLLRNKRYTWERIRSEITNGFFIRDVLKFNLANVSDEAIEIVKKEYIQTEIWDLKRLQRASKAMGPLGSWLQCQVELAEFSKSNQAGTELIKINSDIGRFEAEKAVYLEEIERDDLEIVECEEELEKLDNQIDDMEEALKESAEPGSPLSGRISALNGKLVAEKKINRKLNQISDTGDLTPEDLRRSWDLEPAGDYFRPHNSIGRDKKGTYKYEDPLVRNQTAASLVQQPKGSLFTSEVRRARFLEMTGCYFFRQQKDRKSVQNGSGFIDNAKWNQKVTDKTTQTEDALLSIYVESLLAPHRAAWQKERDSLMRRADGNSAALKSEWEDLERERAEVEAVARQLQASLTSQQLAFEQEKAQHKQTVDQTMAMLEAERNNLERERMRLETERQKFEKLSAEMQQKFSRRSIQDNKRTNSGEDGVQTELFLLQVYLEELRKHPEFSGRKVNVRGTQTEWPGSANGGHGGASGGYPRDGFNGHQNELFGDNRRTSGLNNDISLPNLNISGVNDPFTAQNIEDKLKALDDQDGTVLDNGQPVLNALKPSPPQIINVKNAVSLQQMNGLNLPVKPSSSKRIMGIDELKSKRKYADKYNKIGIVWQDYFPKNNDTMNQSTPLPVARSPGGPPDFHRGAPLTMQPLPDNRRANVSLSPNRVMVSQIYPPQAVASQQTVVMAVPEHPYPLHPRPTTSYSKQSSYPQPMAGAPGPSGFPSQHTVRTEVSPHLYNAKVVPQYQILRNNTPDLARPVPGFYPVSQRINPTVNPSSPEHIIQLTPKSSLQLKR